MVIDQPGILLPVPVETSGNTSSASSQTTALVVVPPMGSYPIVPYSNPSTSNPLTIAQSADASSAVRDAGGRVGTEGRRADFYVTPSGDVVPSTGYRYMSRDAGYLPSLMETMEVPPNPNGTYVTFDRFDIPEPGMLQVPHDASIRGTFDTLQIVDDIRIPNGQWGEASWLEPITSDFPEFGPGGATQAITNQRIVLDSLDDLLE